ncbi:MAG: sulfite exporter TauE/SafE family protein [Alkalispirochaeta sp.]
METIIVSVTEGIMAAGILDEVPFVTVQLFVTMASLLVVSFMIGVVSVLAGVGGGVLFVPVVSALFPIHIDFIRGAGLMVALVGAIAAAPRLMHRRFSRLRIAMPLALCGSVGSIIGARLGLLVSPDGILMLLGVFMIGVAIQTAIQGYRARGGERYLPSGVGVDRNSLSDRIAAAWELFGSYSDPVEGEVFWRARRIVPGMVLFVGIGLLGGMLGVGAGWANVPVLTSLMGLPIKLAAATSGLIIIANSGAATWVYLGTGGIRPLIVAPALVGIIAGTRLGARFLGAAKPQLVRLLVIAILLLAGSRTIIGVIS